MILDDCFVNKYCKINEKDLIHIIVLVLYYLFALIKQE